MVSKDEVEEALRQLGGEGTTRDVYTQLLNSGVMGDYYKNQNVITSIVSSTLARAAKWGTIRREFRGGIHDYKRQVKGSTIWVLVPESQSQNQ